MKYLTIVFIIGGSAEPGRKRLPFGQGRAAFAAGFGARFGAGTSQQSRAVPAWWPKDGGCGGDGHRVSPSCPLRVQGCPHAGLHWGSLWGQGGHGPSLGDRGSFCVVPVVTRGVGLAPFSTQAFAGGLTSLFPAGGGLRVVFLSLCSPAVRCLAEAGWLVVALTVEVAHG